MIAAPPRPDAPGTGLLHVHDFRQFRSLAVHVVGMAIVTTLTPRPDRVEKARACMSCREVRPAAGFDIVRDARGLQTRRRVCRTCIDRVDARLAAGDDPDQIARELSVSKVLVRERAQVAQRKLPVKQARTRTCAACKTEHPIHRYELRTSPTGKRIRRNICDICVATIDRLLASRKNAREVADATGASLAVVRERRRGLGIADELPRTDPHLVREVIRLAGDTERPEISARTGIRPDRVRRILVAAGVHTPAAEQPRATAEQIAQAALLLADKATYAEVSRTVGLSVRQLKGLFPGHTRPSENRALIAWLSANPEIRKLYDEINRVA